MQRTASSNDQTDSACIKMAPNKHCLGLCLLLILTATYILQMASINSIVSLVNKNIFKRNQKSIYIHQSNNNEVARNDNNKCVNRISSELVENKNTTHSSQL